MDDYTLASKIFGSSRAEEGTANRTVSMVTGVAVENSTDGLVKIDIGGDVTGDDPYIYVPTGPSVSAGDIVQVQLAGPLGKTPFVANVAGWGDRIASVAEQAEAVAEEAKEAAEGAGTQYFWQNDSDAETYGGAGVHVTNDRKDDWVEAVADDFSDLSDNHPYHNILMNSLGILLRRALNNLVTITRNAIAFYDGEGNGASNVVATFGASGAQIGKSTSQHAVVDANGLAVYNGDGSIARVNSVDVVAVKTASDEANTLLDGMKDAAQAAGTTLNGIYADAETAKSSAATASAAAATASTDASAARTMAEGASANAAIAKQSADKATFALSDVENVLGTLNWIAEHGEYVLTSDQSIVDGKAYYTRSGTSPNYTYTIVANPTASELSTYYELSIDTALSQYVASHLALTDAGLYIIKDNSGYKALFSNTGMTVYDQSGMSVAQFGELTRLGNEDSTHINIDSDSMDFISSNGSTLAYASEERFMARRLEAVDGVNIGRYTLFVAQNGNLALRKRY